MKDEILAALNVENLSSRNIRERFGHEGIAACDELERAGLIFSGFDGFGTEYGMSPFPIWPEGED